MYLITQKIFISYVNNKPTVGIGILFLTVLFLTRQQFIQIFKFKRFVNSKKNKLFELNVIQRTR